MKIVELRILPPLAIARLGASPTPLDNYELDTDPDEPLGFRRIVPAETFDLDQETGEIRRAYRPARIRFRDGDEIRPVAPFLEVFARISPGDELVPLTISLLQANGATPADLRWTVDLGNIKLFRRTGNPDDKIGASLTVDDHGRHPVEGTCPNFLPDKRLPLGWVQYVRPTRAFPEIRFRYTPAAGHVYGAQLTRKVSDDLPAVPDPVLTPDRVLYDPGKDWVGFNDSTTPVPVQTAPAQIYAGYPSSKDQTQVSWGYLDDECDGTVSVALRIGDRTFSAFARIGAGPPTFAPDSIPIRTIHDDLDQAAFGPAIDLDRPVDLAEAEEIVRRAVESIRLLNTTVMNGNTVNGRINAASTMVRQDANDFGRYYAPIMAAPIVDNHAIIALHQTILAALRSGTGAWFADTLRRPEEVGDLSDAGRRKMPGMMRGADGRHLVLTRRQIDTIVRACIGSMFANAEEGAQP